MATTGCPYSSGNDSNDPTSSYHDYLKLDQVLTANNRQTTAHTEHLFITIHQVYELWFKQMIHEIHAILRIFEREVSDKNLLFVHNCLKRLTKILKNLGEQFEVLETMSATEFLEFRTYLGTASGFQSWQFRLFENLMGLKPSSRNKYGKRDYKTFLKKEHAALIAEAEVGTNLFTVVCDWLARCPHLYSKNWDFWECYQNIIQNKVENEEVTEENWRLVLDQDYYESMLEEQRVHLPYDAFKGAVFVNCYQNEPLLQVPFQILTDLLDIENNLRGFRMRHANMVHRMIGSKVGTGGSSGYHYLKTSALKHQIFSDLFEMASYYITPEELPRLPEDIVVQLGTPKAEALNLPEKEPEPRVAPRQSFTENLRNRLFPTNT